MIDYCRVGSVAQCCDVTQMLDRLSGAGSIKHDPVPRRVAYRAFRLPGAGGQGQIGNILDRGNKMLWRLGDNIVIHTIYRGRKLSRSRAEGRCCR